MCAFPLLSPAWFRNTELWICIYQALPFLFPTLYSFMRFLMMTSSWLFIPAYIHRLHSDHHLIWRLLHWKQVNLLLQMWIAPLMPIQNIRGIAILLPADLSVAYFLCIKHALLCIILVEMLKMLLTCVSNMYYISRIYSMSVSTNNVY